ncbi:MAG: DUF2125 domain-containing protein [Proteobacteria bacterium]|nr:DUF2125 domain-containing protein [Pseudomonadota bacterium]
MTSKFPNDKTRMSKIGILTVLGSTVIIMLTGKGPVTEKVVQRHLDEFSEHVANFAAKSGKEGVFKHGEFTMGGYTFNRHAVIDGVSLAITRPSLTNPVSWELSTPKVFVVADQLYARRLYYVLNAPITVKRNGEQYANITFADPLRYGHLETATSLKQTFRLPTSITVMPSKMMDEEDAETGITITYDPGARIEIESAMDHSKRDAHYELNNIVVATPDEEPLSVAALNSDLHESVSGENVTKGTYQLNMLSVKTPGMDKPCDMKVDMAYTGDQPLQRLTGMAPSLPGAAVNIKALGMDCGSFKITTDGTLSRQDQDPLPSGEVKLAITNAQALLASGMLDESAKTMLGQALMKITGKPLDAITDVSVPLKREKGGTFYIGDVTFEEMAATLFSSMFDLNKMVPPTTAQPMPLPPEATGEQAPEPQLPDPEATLLKEGDTLFKEAPKTGSKTAEPAPMD